jgi:predicted NUDIX family phosphoesterase
MQTPTPQSSAQAIPQTAPEHILVVKRDTLFQDTPAWHGLKNVDLDAYLSLIQIHKEFHPRPDMELDATYKQIIPYMVFKHGDRYFLMQRSGKASETRLQSKYTLGIGGHVRAEDLQEGSTLFDWARREFHEEVSYNGNLTITSLGMLNDDSNEVGKVHVGLVLLLEGDSDQISVHEELKSGELLTLEECAAYADHMETWSRFIFDALI